LDAVQVSFIADKNQELLTFQQDKLDFMTGIEASSVDAILDEDGKLKPELAGKFVVQKQPYLNTQYIGFQMDHADEGHPFADKRVRQALNYAIDREEMVSYLLNNLGTPGTAGIIPPAAAAFDAEKVVGYSYDPKKASILLKEAGFGEGKEFPQTKLYTTIHSKPFVEYLQKQWAEVGINVEIVINPVPNHQELIDNGKVDFFRASWQGDYPDAENYLAMFYSKNISPAGPNKTHFRNDTFDQLYEAARQEQDGFKRFDIYQEMDKILIEEAPMIVLFYDEVLRLTQNDVVGLDPNPMNVLKLERADFKTKEDLNQLGE
ncbi:MAG: ABC transporter substrate-binding protein, partial [Cyclobacteriaceae bacterium]